jgi:flagellar protein FliO/FliZ
MPALTFFFAFVAVLALIGVAAWLVRRFAGNRLGASPNRGRMPRLAVIDAAAVDGRRRLVLVRRDNIEHLLMIGGPTDIVVEANIVRATQARDQLPQRPGGVGAEPQPRITALPEMGGFGEADGARPEVLDHPEPQMPEPPPRAPRPSFADDIRRVAPSLSERRSAERSDPLTGFTPEPLSLRPEPRSEPRGEPMTTRNPSRNEPLIPRPQRQTEAPKLPPLRVPERAAAPSPPPPPAPPPQAPSAADQNLAEMAQRLEAALRRPAGEAGETRVGAPSMAPEPPLRSQPRNEAPAAAPVAAPKSGFENLEDEMASLLGRPKPHS